MKTYSATEILEKWEDENDYDSKTGEFIVTIFLNNSASTKRLATQLQQFGYKSQIITDQHELKNSLLKQKPDLLIMSMEFPEGKGSSLLKSAMQKSTAELPVIYISDNNSVENQLDAVNNGGIAFLPEQFELTAILDQLDQISNRSSEAPYRILIVDDNDMIAEHYSIILGAVNMQTSIVSNPLRIMEAMADFEPDLILMDLHMPECSGIDLAKVIRQQDEFNSIPIVFLSMEKDAEQQLSAIKLGGDDFLIKGIDAKHLVTSVSARVKRARKLRALMLKDSLSGLLNHSTIKQQLANETKRAIRNGSNFCYAMLDIDNFKQINDSYGHATGDRVIRQLSHLLRQRLRSTDIVGRYGGEEFAIIMPDTSLADAQAVLNEIRQSFSDLTFQVAGKNLKCTLPCELSCAFQASFSGGIADFASYNSPSSLHDAADKLLYKSKRNGRNQISVALKEIA
ncbi:MAG: diguanylate cyclase [Gammaproteobacteria bacterium]|nr:diguanylate cyclase [Gammaproteobacteria bacterium]